MTDPAPSHTVVITQPDPEPTDDRPDTAEHESLDWLHQRWANCVAEARMIPEAFTHPPNLMQAFDYARAGAFTTATEGGAARWINTMWATATLPFAAAALTVLWARGRFSRSIVFVACLLLVGTGIAQIPVLGWLIPAAINMTAW